MKPGGSLFGSESADTREPEVESAVSPAGDDVIAKALRMTVLGLSAASLLSILGALWMLRSDESATTTTTPTGGIFVDRPKPTDAEIPNAPFVDITNSAGIKYTQYNGATGELMLPENVTGGCAFFDYDNDGDSDIFFVNATTLKPGVAPPADARCALYRNDGGGKFTDVSAETGANVQLYGMGVAIGDYDGDGWRDVFISGLGAHRLLRNEQGKFIDVTEASGVAVGSDRWSTSCGFLDYDRDGDLDLFVCNYVTWSPAIDQQLDHRFMSEPTYMPPFYFTGGYCLLYQNKGSGKFEDVSESAGIRAVNPATSLPAAKALGCVFADIDEDGWIDIVVANDQVPSFLFHNQQDGTFKEIGSPAGMGFGHGGTPVAGMGIDLCRSGTEGVMIGIANVNKSPTAMYRSQIDRLKYLDETLQLGVYADSLMMTTWGLFFVDYDLDGRLDMFQANGNINTEKASEMEGVLYRQPVQLFWNRGDQATPKYAMVPARQMIPPGTEELRKLLARGAAFADIDDDGDIDFLITQMYGPPMLLRNDQKLGHHWVRFRLVGKDMNRDAIGAWVDLTAGGRTQTRQVMPTCSYLAQVEPTVTFGLGKLTEVEKVEITWPDGSKQVVSEFSIDKLNVIQQP